MVGETRRIGERLAVGDGGSEDGRIANDCPTSNSTTNPTLMRNRPTSKSTALTLTREIQALSHHTQHKRPTGDIQTFNCSHDSHDHVILCYGWRDEMDIRAMTRQHLYLRDSSILRTSENNSRRNLRDGFKCTD
ncbi:hypothetical protein Tco_0953083 [Tanacetum coccineum]|uniref:Uncharacterized protein n=1 Tax=Tanacetum coccineum TaxID=301880 RepID=A0ABQ5E1N8_9ASTR